MKTSLRFALSLLLFAGLAASGRADWNVWTRARTERALRDAMPETQTSVKLGEARNEWESFQILMRSDKPVRGVRIEPGELRGPGGAVLASDTRIFRQHQFHLTVPTNRNENFTPGWYPDALVPDRHPLTGKPLDAGRFVAMPFDLPADETHGFLIDLYAPADAAPGEYHGTFRAIGEGQPAREIPVTLTVWDFELPAVPTMETALGSPAARMRGYYAGRAKAGKEKAPTDWDAIDAQCAELLSRNRINATPSGSFAPMAQPDGSFEIPDGQIDAVRAFVDRYHVNAVQIPHPSSVVKDLVAEGDKLRAWLAAWDRAAKKLDRPGVTLFIYLKDEPNDEDEYHYVQRWGRAIRDAHSAAKVMVVEQTWSSNEKWGDLDGAVDIWCPLFSLFKAESARKRQTLGEKLWTYTALCQMQPTPWWQTDYPLLNYRVPAWIAWRYRIRGLLYWGGMSYWRDVDDPWTEPGTLDRRNRSREQMYNGEGSLLYPARAVGYEGVASSLRVKAIRDCIEDYEYMAILERLGLAAEAEKIVLPLAASWFAWEKDPTAYETARAKLAERIIAAKN